jgi:hypothetical protein
MEHQILVEKRRDARQPAGAVERVERCEMGVPAAEDVDEPVAADDVRDGVRRGGERGGLLAAVNALSEAGRKISRLSCTAGKPTTP